MTWPDHLPKLCPGCGSPYSEKWVGGYYGWTCGSKSIGHAFDKKLCFNLAVDCAVLHWKTRALKAEGVLTENRDELIAILEEHGIQEDGPNVRLADILARVVRESAALADRLSGAELERDRLGAELEAIYVKDSVRTKECNILTQENRDLAARLKAVEAALLESDKAAILKFLAECDAGLHPLSAEDEAALQRAEPELKRKLRAILANAAPKTNA